MQVLLAVILIMMGIYTCLSVIAIMYAKQIISDTELADDKITIASERIVKEHNELAKKILELQEITNAHEFKLSGQFLHGMKK